MTHRIEKIRKLDDSLKMFCKINELISAINEMSENKQEDEEEVKVTVSWYEMDKGEPDAALVVQTRYMAKSEARRLGLL